MANEHNPYQFIVDGNHRPKKSPLSLNSGSKQTRIMIFAGGLVVLLVLMMIVWTILSSGNSGPKEELIRAGQQQTELIRISKIGADRAKGSQAKNLATTVSLTATSDQATLISTLKSSKIKVSTKEFALGKNTKTDAELTSAEQANRFDEAFVETIQKQLTAYQKTLKSAYDKTNNKALKEALAAQYESAGLLAAAE